MIAISAIRMGRAKKQKWVVLQLEVVNLNPKLIWVDLKLLYFFFIAASELSFRSILLIIRER